MIGSDDADQGEEPQLPPALASAEPPADQVRSKPFTSTFLLSACLFGLIWTIVLLAFVVVKTRVASTVVTTLTSAVAVGTGIIGVFQPPKLPTVDPKVTRRVVTVILCVDLAVSVGWFSWSRYEAGQSVDVLSTVTLGQNINVLPGGHATLDVAITARRDTVVLVFQVVDHNPTSEVVSRTRRSW